ncbi:MAG: DUF2961 domain-containing protein [Saprospiraceae bacterium]|nr:DUF2961 domain-containing protein [Saprospiraceae bacterium]
MIIVLYWCVRVEVSYFNLEDGLKLKYMRFFYLIILLSILSCKPNETHNTRHDNVLYRYHEVAHSHWSSFENLNGKKGRGGLENFGAKGHAYDHLKVGEEKVLLDIKGSGIINRMWFTLRERSPRELRGLVLEFYWDQSAEPAISAPFGDFFAVGLSEGLAFENALFASPEGRSFNSYLQMPFKKGARVLIRNELDKDVDMLFYDIDYQELDRWDESFMYLHAYWHRDTATALARDFEILPAIEGHGRFLGTSISVQVNPRYMGTWWGEGEVKMYLDGDREYPTLVGTGTEDYIGTGWGQGQYTGNYQGCTRADGDHFMYSFYRFHIPDPIFFHADCRITIQQMGGGTKEKIVALQDQDVPLLPVEIIGPESTLFPIYKPGQVTNLSDASVPGNDRNWVNYYRSDDVSAIAYYYLDRPNNNLPALQEVKIRQYKL